MTCHQCRCHLDLVPGASRNLEANESKTVSNAVNVKDFLQHRALEDEFHFGHFEQRLQNVAGSEKDGPPRNQGFVCVCVLSWFSGQGPQ